MDDFTIPDFLRISSEQRAASWKGRRLTKPSKTDVKVTRNEDASTRAFRREMERQAEQKKRERIQRLRENYK